MTQAAKDDLRMCNHSPKQQVRGSRGKNMPVRKNMWYIILCYIGLLQEVTNMMFKKIRKYLIVLMAVVMVASVAVIPTSAASYAYYCSGCSQLCPVGRDYFGGLLSWSQGGSTYNRFYGQTSTSTAGQMCFASATLFYLGTQCDYTTNTYVNGAYTTTGSFTGNSNQYSGSCNQNHNVWWKLKSPPRFLRGGESLLLNGGTYD